MPHDTGPENPGRRRFLTAAGKTAAAAIGVTLLPGCMQRALAIPAARVTGTITDVQHVVILLQENRSFDHYFGTMAGVRGFGDRWPIPLPSGASVWHQSDGKREILPFHLDTQSTTAMRVPGTPHSWPDSQQAWNEGRLGFWPKFKEFQSMGYYEQVDIPFQRALAEAFTICDAHHCSIQSGTLANRVMFMTGTNVKPGLDGPATTQEQAVISNANNRGAQFGAYDWTTYPERLEAAGVRWRVYQDPADNWDGVLAPWESFAQYQRAAPSHPLFENAMRARSLDDLRADVALERLPQVSWIVPPPVWSEHPSESSPLQGASFTQQPWSKGGWVNSQIFDHTSVIRFLEARFDVAEPNISAWHRAVSGDLTGCFNFEEPDAVMPPLPDMSAAVGKKLELDGAPVAVPSLQTLPKQAQGMRYSRALPYELHVHALHGAESNELELSFESAGSAGAVFHVYDLLHLERVPRRYTVEAGKTLSDRWNTADDSGRYEVQVLGPNGFARKFAGSVETGTERRSATAVPEIELEYEPDQDGLKLLLSNDGDEACVLTVQMRVYADESFSIELPARCNGVEHRWSIEAQANWYDFSVTAAGAPDWSRRFAGRMENGRDGLSDPALGDPTISHG